MSKFFLYARKSTDEPDRQILSIEAQITELREFGEREHLEIVQEFIESQTAKEPGRPIFNQMLSLIEKGFAQGILAWHPDRLARNSVDGGRIIYLIDTTKIRELKFPTFWFDATPQGKFMLNIAFGQSKYYIDNLSENVKRGLRQKVRRGEYPGVAPTGYLNDKVNHKIVKDPERYRLVQKLFELYATKNYSLKDLRNEITEIGLVSRNGKRLTVSNIQMILRNPFYYGAFKFNGELYEGKHEPAITKKLFDKVQEVMSEKSRPKKRGEKTYIFRGLLKCGECGCAITAEDKTKKSGRHYVYYRCTKKKDVCSQPYIREEILASQISDILQKVSLPEDWAEPMLAQLETDEASTAQSDALFAQNLKNEVMACEEKLDTLLDAHLEKTITGEEYTAKKNKILARKIEIEQKLKDFKRQGNRWLERTRNLILAAHQANFVALGDNFSEKKNYLEKVGSNPQLAERAVSVSFRNDWQILAEFNAERRSREATFPIHTMWLRGLDSNQGDMIQSHVSYR